MAFEPYKPPQQMQATTQPSNGFDAMRRRLEQRFTGQAQQGQDAIQRKLASLGNLNSGAAIKLQQQNQEQVGQQREDALAGIEAQEAQQNFQVAEAQKGREFQGMEAQKGRDFQGGQFDKSFGLDERTKLGQLDLAQQEMLMKQSEQDFNTITSAREQGYGYDLSQALPEHLKRRLYPQGYPTNPQATPSPEQQKEIELKRKMGGFY